MQRSLINDLALWEALKDAAASRSCTSFLESLVIDCSPRPLPFGRVAEPWQWDLLGPVIPAVEKLALVRKSYSGPVSFWRTLPRGHDKTGSIGRLLSWALAYSRRKLSIYTAAADKDQAALILQSMAREAELNPWLAKRVRYFSDGARGAGGALTVLSSDAPSSSGLTPDLTILDEITWWKRPDLWGILFSGREKRPGSVVVVITNAGERGSWQEKILLDARKDPRWDVYEAPLRAQLASWMSPEAIASMRKLLPAPLARRVIDNEWIDPGEAGYLSRAEVLACEELGRQLGLCRQVRGRSGVRYAVGIDYGPKRDRTALCVVHRHEDGRIVVDRLDVFQGSVERPVPISLVEEWLEEVCQEFNRPVLVFDPYQMESLIQKLELHYEVVRHEARGGKANYEMAENLRSLIANGQMAWYPDAGQVWTGGEPDTLADEFARLVVRVMSYGYRFDHPPGFHDDRVVALGMAALECCRMDPSAPGVPPVALPRKGITPLRERRDRARERGIWGLK